MKSKETWSSHIYIRFPFSLLPGFEETSFVVDGEGVVYKVIKARRL